MKISFMVRMLTRNKIRVIDARVVLRTEDGALIHMSYGGRATFPDELEGALREVSSRHLIDPSRYYFRTNPLFETGRPDTPGSTASWRPAAAA